MSPILSIFWNVCLLRTGPEQMPGASSMLTAVIVANLALSIIAGLISPFTASPVAAVGIAILGIAWLGSFTYVALGLRRLGHRFTQVATALFGADALLTAISLPGITALRLLDPVPGTAPMAFLEFLQLFLLIWWLSVIGNVFARALDQGRATGIAIAVLVMISGVLLSATSFPPEYAAVTTPSTLN